MSTAKEGVFSQSGILSPCPSTLSAARHAPPCWLREGPRLRLQGLPTLWLSGRVLAWPSALCETQTSR